MSDPIDDAFGDMYYPGSRRKRPRPKDRQPVPAKDEQPWDQPKIKLVRGQQVEMYTIGQLCMAINRRPVTWRSWELKGIVPKARYRDSNGRRLFSRAQVEGLVALCEKYGILDFVVRPDSIPKGFTTEVALLWRSS